MFHGTTSSNSSKSSLGSTMRGEQLFVSVIYDFEYISEDGKRVFMKENEILLLINKTNHDWWQVIRRGDRRPFYAPAKYVVEFRPQGEQRRELKLKAGGRDGNPPWHINSNKNFRPVFSTFTGKGQTQTGPPGMEGLAYGGNKRHSYAPPPGGRFSERYRSNSLDSILVADLDRVAAQGPVQPVRHSYHVSTGPVPGTTYHIYPSEQHLMPKSQVTLIRGGVGLSKRPTIEGLDKRKSWSLDISSAASSRTNTVSLKNVAESVSSKTAGSTSSRLSSYQNTDGLVGIGSRDRTGQGSPDPRNLKKKPVPLPRSKVPVAEQQPQAPVKKQTEKLFQRARTDLGCDALSFYKAKKMSQGSAGIKYPAPKVPAFSKPVPQKRTVPSLAASHATLCDIPSQSTSSLVSLNSKGPRPAVKDKPSFSTFKTSQMGLGSRTKPDEAKAKSKTKSGVREKRISRASSEGDLLGQLQEVEKSSELSSSIEKPVVPMKNNCAPEAVTDSRLSSTAQMESHDNKSNASAGQSTFEDNTQRTHRSEPLTITSLPLIDKTSNDNVVEWMDKSCSSSYASNESSSILLSATAERSTDVSMEDQDLFSLESCTPGEPGQADRLLMSPCSTTSRSPPSPLLGMTPKRQVSEDWDEYEDTPSGRKFYFNSATKEKSWKPPRKSKGSEADYSAPTSPCPGGSSIVEEVLMDNSTENNVYTEEDANSDLKENQVPVGYERKTNVDNGSPFFVNMFTGVRWFSAETTSGKTYYYEENGNESCWVLPNVSQTIQDVSGSSSTAASATNFPEVSRKQSLPDHLKTVEDEPEVEDLCEESVALRAPRKHSNVRPLTTLPTPTRARPEITRLHLPISSPNIQIGKINIIVLKQGPLNKTKLVENGKKHRKNWTVSHVVLTDLFLLFFKDAKTFGQMQSGSNQPKPEQCVDLNGANVAWCTGDKSKRSNVFEVSAQLLGMTVLLQDDDLAIAAEWCREIGDVADRLTKKSSDTMDPSGRKKFSAESSIQPSSTLQLPARKVNSSGGPRVNRTKSLKMKLLGSSDELVQTAPSTPTTGLATGPSYIQHQSKVNIREKLRKFFMRRPAMDDLFRRGIMKNEPVFGSTLRELQVTDLSDVPLFVKKCVAEIEKGDLLKTDGVYRQSGNLSHIQRIRLQVDQGNLCILETVDDVHVLTGALKLFFRELKEPLILWEIVDKLLLACNHQSKKVKLKQMKDCIMSLPQPHKATLAYLLRHLVKVTSFKDTNRMQIPTMAIVFGPTLMWPPSNLVTHNLALSMLQQNIIVEALLTNVETIFSP